jgi:TPP-dependent pyruvate/acetoin dehydrogenase alpha subunit
MEGRTSDPITNFGKWLEGPEHSATTEEIEAINVRSISADAAEAVDYALNAPYPDPSRSTCMSSPD